MIIGLTGTREFQNKLRKALGGTPCVTLTEGYSTALDVQIPWDSLPGNWIVFTSAKGAEFFGIRYREAGSPPLCSCQFSVIGSETRKAVQALGFPVTLCPEAYHSRALAEMLLGTVNPGQKICLFCSRQGSHHLEKTAAERGVPCLRLEIYSTSFQSSENPPKVDYVAFGSGEGVRNLRKSGYLLGNAIPVCIGPICAEACRECYGVEPMVAEQCTVEAMASLFRTLCKK